MRVDAAEAGEDEVQLVEGEIAGHEPEQTLNDLQSAS
jgi:hypothetical protein